MNPRVRSAVVVGAVVLVEGCRQVVGIHDEPRFNGDADAGGTACGRITFANDECAACVSASCCGEAQRCAGAAGCSAFTGCVAACASGDVACTSGCRARFPSGYGFEASSLASCQATRCADACQLTCGGYVYPDTSCASCSVAHCCDVAAACMNDAECATLSACERSCALADDVCLALCELAHPDGVAHERAFSTCSQTACAASCIAPRWLCLQHPTAPPPAVGVSVDITYTFNDYVTLRPVAGLSVRACGRTDPQCAATLAGPVLTDDNGQARLRIATGAFDGYAEITGNDYMPLLVYLPPITTTFGAPGLPAITQSAFSLLLLQLVPTADPAHGHVIGVTRDCGRRPAGGVKLAISPDDGKSTPFYFVQRTPVAGPGTTSDDNYAAGGFLDVSPSPSLAVRGTVVENGLSLPEAHVIVRPGTVSVALLFSAPP